MGRARTESTKRPTHQQSIGWKLNGKSTFRKTQNIMKDIKAMGIQTWKEVDGGESHLQLRLTKARDAT